MAVHPGLLETTLSKTWMENGCPRSVRPLGLPLLRCLYRWIFLKPERVTASILYAATAPASEVLLERVGIEIM